MGSAVCWAPIPWQCSLHSCVCVEYSPLKWISGDNRWKTVTVWHHSSLLNHLSRHTGPGWAISTTPLLHLSCCSVCTFKNKLHSKNLENMFLFPFSLHIYSTGDRLTVNSSAACWTSFPHHRTYHLPTSWLIGLCKWPLWLTPLMIFATLNKQSLALAASHDPHMTTTWA